MKKYKFSQLNPVGQVAAAINYMDGYNNDEREGTITFSEAMEYCKDIEDDIFYTIEGEDHDEN